jgi:hypothetical protein
MRRSLIVMFVALLALLLAACAPKSATAPAPTQPPDNGASAQATSTPPAQATEPAAAASTPEAAKPAATPDMEKVIKAQPDDWKRGPDGAKVTIIEWGDFQ